MARETADLVIIGGGIVGMSIAYQVRRRSSWRVVVLEKGRGLGEGSTGGSSAITRQRYSHAETIRIARGGNVVLRNWAEFTGLDSPRGGYYPIGVLWMLPNDRHAVEADRDRLRAHGIDAVLLDGEELQSRFPALSTCMEPFDLTGDRSHECRPGDAFLLEQDAGYADATGVLEDMADAARRVGVDVRIRSTVTAVHVSGSKVDGVTVADGTRIDAGVVINAAGPWCNRINAMAGLDHQWDLVPTRVQVLYRELPPEVPRPLPVVCDGSSGVYFRPEVGAQQIILGSLLEEDEQEATDPDSSNPMADRAFLDIKIHALHHRIPTLPHRGTVAGMAAMYTINRQDVHPIVGPTAIEGFVVCNGFSGHGFKEAPMFGAILARWLTGEEASFDVDVPLEFFSIDRSPIAVAHKNVLA